ncbi:MAG: peptidase M14 [Gammaproteobacteria bacterium]|nr:peptidase M14 [Gammaproteobacteria bacterium]
MYRSALSVILLLAAASLHGAPGLPSGFIEQRDVSIPSPGEVLGFEPGARHPRNDEIVRYFETLAAATDRVRIEVTGHSHDGRPLLLAYFGSPERLTQLDDLRAGRRAASRAGEGPPVIWLGYSVHGNEASGASASLVTAWYLAASESVEARAWRDEVLVIMEPVLNPDGLDRFAHWVNMHRGRHPSADPVDREHREAWPNGRTNYYWFDLNRDWLPLVHPESRARIANYHRWRPHVLTDHHEMGHLTSYFFQPGVPERGNPLQPPKNVELTAELAAYHAAALDAAGEPYFTQERFDDYYVGKGSTYPDLTGGVGILFEQGSARGHLMRTPFGLRTFADAVANQVRTSLSTVRGSHALGDDLIAYQAAFFREQQQAARRERNSGWLLGDGGDPGRAQRLLDVLLQHDIQVRPVTETVTIGGRDHAPGSAWALPADQDHYLLLQSMFSEPTELEMDTFYDVSAWPLQRSFGLPLSRVNRLPATAAALTEVPRPTAAELPDQAVAWVIPWNQYGAAPTLAALLDDELRIQAATRPITVTTAAGPRALTRGSLVIHPAIQPLAPAELRQRLQALSAHHGIEVLAATDGLTPAGPDLGSPSLPMLRTPRVAMLTGEGLRPNHAGYIWHWFDTRLEQPLTRIDWWRLANGFEPGRRGALDGLTHLILPDGDYSLLPATLQTQLEAFVRTGGHLIAARGASRFVEGLSLDWSFAGEPPERERAEQRPYGEHEADFARELIGGSALSVVLDASHPLAFGYPDGEIAAFRRGAHRLQATANPYATPGRYAEDPLLAGYLSAENHTRLAGSPALSATRVGPGLVIRMADDYLFRGYWLGTERLFANALFFSSLIGETRLPAND